MGELSDVAREKLIEVMGKERHGHVPECTSSTDLARWSCRCGGWSGHAGGFDGHVVGAMLDAALGAVDEGERCSTCGGTGDAGASRDGKGPFSLVACSFCAGSGKVNPRWLVVRVLEDAGKLERRGWAPRSGAEMTYPPPDSQFKHGYIAPADLVPVFREVFPVPQARKCDHAWHEARVVKRANVCPACGEQNNDGSRW